VNHNGKMSGSARVHGGAVGSKGSGVSHGSGLIVGTVDEVFSRCGLGERYLLRSRSLSSQWRQISGGPRPTPGDDPGSVFRLSRVDER
jgi:hypothetical protein